MKIPPIVFTVLALVPLGVAFAMPSVIGQQSFGEKLGKFDEALHEHWKPRPKENQVGDSAGDYFRDYSPLGPGDKGLGVDMAGGGPKLPSKCVDGSGCKDCFGKAQGDLQHLRFSLEKLRAIGEWTKDFTTKSIAFGDGVSGVHGAAALGWWPERKKIEESYVVFGKAYDAKYDELIGDLEVALHDIGKCEAKHFGTDDWYDRYGFMYYTFAADRYKR
jgi:hypothetical protein